MPSIRAALLNKASPILLQVKNLKTHFPLPGGQTAKAVDGVSFHVDAGETVCIVGESGCGKSVTSFSIMQLLPRSARHPQGEILFQGDDILQMSVHQKRKMRGARMAMIFQEPGTALNPVIRVGKQVDEALRTHLGLSRAAAKERTIDLFREVGIPHPEARYKAWPHELSGGMKQRIMIAMALACQPELLIADEPTTALDVTVQAQILKLMQKLKSDHQAAILLITHDLSVVNQVADRVIVMYAGRVVETADRRTLFSRPQHPYTKALLKAIPRSELRGEELWEIPGRVPPATDFPSHCRFADRCDSCVDACRQEDPQLYNIADDHQVACLLYKEEESP
jgi:peptide/nickel transport system ATP-binding protein